MKITVILKNKWYFPYEFYFMKYLGLGHLSHSVAMDVGPSSSVVQCRLTSLRTTKFRCKINVFLTQGHGSDKLSILYSNNYQGRVYKIVIVMSPACLWHLLYDGPVDMQIWALLTRSRHRVPDTQRPLRPMGLLFMFNIGMMSFS